MINLIPPEGKKKISREYWLRVAAVWMLLIWITLVVFIFELLPSLVFVNALKNTMSEQFDQAMAASAAYEETEQLVRETNALIDHLDTVGAELFYSELLHELDNVARDHADISSFEFVTLDGEIETIVLSGIASTRTSLANFRDSLEAHPRFHSIDLPISNLAKESDIVFSISVSLLGEDELIE